VLDEGGSPLRQTSFLGASHSEDGPSKRLLRYRIRATGDERWSTGACESGARRGRRRVVLAVSVIHDVTEREPQRSVFAFWQRAARC